jgi:hypothetical protein
MAKNNIDNFKKRGASIRHEYLPKNKVHKEIRLGTVDKGGVPSYQVIKVS